MPMRKTKKNPDDYPVWYYKPPEGDIVYAFDKDCFDYDILGFVYLITFPDGMKYIGKKNLYTLQKLPGRKDGKLRLHRVGYEYKNTGKGKRQLYEIIRKETDWRTYSGSAEGYKDMIPVSREILALARSKRELTYLEAKYQFIYEVLERNDFINNNILGSFYKGVLGGED